MAEVGPREHKITLQEARQEMQDDRNMRCVACGQFIEAEQRDDSIRCFSCERYYEEYKAGVFDDEYSLYDLVADMAEERAEEEQVDQPYDPADDYYEPYDSLYGFDSDYY